MGSKPAGRGNDFYNQTSCRVSIIEFCKTMPYAYEFIGFSPQLGNFSKSSGRQKSPAWPPGYWVEGYPRAF